MAWRGNLKNNSGITLIEVAILILILGLIAVPMIKIYQVYREDELSRRTEGNPIVIQSALQKYVLRTGRYPRPALRNLPFADPDFGTEYTGAIAVCTPGTGVVCRAAGFRDVQPVDGVNDNVLIGDVPYAELGLPLYYYTDGYGTKFTYAVTESLTATASFADANGVIKLEHRIVGQDRVGTASNVHYVIVSHGQNQKGSFAEGGILIESCVGVGRELENCDNDGLFTDNFDFIGVAPNIVYTKYIAEGGAADYYDDNVVYSVTTATDIWTRTVGTPDIYSRNAGNIRMGAGTAPGASVNPTARLHVMGDVKTQTVEVNRLCDQTGCPAEGSAAGLAAPAYKPNVFTPSVIAGSINVDNESLPGGGISCDDTGLVGISNSDENCSAGLISVTPATGTALGSCATGWPTGTDASGQFTCGTP